MPAKVHKKKSGCFSVTSDGGTHAKCTTKRKAKSQQKLLNAISHGYKPR